MNEEQIKQYYERIEKLLNGANKETYGFAPEEIRQILKWYEVLQQENQQLNQLLKDKGFIIDKLMEENRQLKEELEKIKQPTIFIDTQDMEERYGEQLYQDYLVEQNKDLQQRIDNSIRFIEENKNKTYAPYGDNEDTDYEVCLDEDEIKYLLKLLRGENK